MKVTKKIIFAALAFLLLLASVALLLLNKEQTCHSYFSNSEFREKNDTYVYYVHGINSFTSNNQDGLLHHFSKLSHDLPDNFQQDLATVNNTIKNMGWQALEGNGMFGNGIKDFTSGFTVSSGSYTNQFRQKENLLILNIKALTYPQENYENGHDYIKYEDQYVWSITIIEVYNHF